MIDGENLPHSLSPLGNMAVASPWFGDATAAGRWVASGGLGPKYNSTTDKHGEAKPNL